MNKEKTPNYEAYTLEDNGLSSIPDSECSKVLAGAAWDDCGGIVLRLSIINTRRPVYLVRVTD